MLTPNILDRRLSPVVQGGVIRITARESTDLEFKRDLNLAAIRKSLKTVSAFANQRGGWVVFGVADRPRDLVGIGNADIDDGEISEQFVQNLSPVPEYKFQTLDYHGLRVGVLEVYSLEKPPIIATRDLNGPQGEDFVLRKGTIYVRRRGQTAAIAGEEFSQLMRIRDERIEQRLFQFLGQGRKIGFDRAVVAAQQGEGEGAMSFYLPAEAARSLNVIDRARIVEEDGAPAYEILGNVQLTVPADDDPRGPMRASESADVMRPEIRRIYWEDFPWSFAHLKKAADHLGFWEEERGDQVNTGREPLTGTTIYYEPGRTAILNFARQNPEEFVDIVGSAATRAEWRRRNQQA